MSARDNLHDLAAAFGQAATDIHAAANHQVRHDATHVEAQAQGASETPGSAVAVTYGDASAHITSVAPYQVQQADGREPLHVDPNEVSQRLAGELAGVGKTVLMKRLGQ